MKEDILYATAVADVQDLVDYVVSQCYNFSTEHDYDVVWVMDMFRRLLAQTYNQLSP